MPLDARLRRIERHAGIDGSGPSAGALGQNGTKLVHVVQIAGREPFPPLPTCPRCGRCIAFLIRVLRATPPEAPTIAPRAE